MLGDREKSLAKGMDDYVSKPLKPKLLMQTINKCIHNINQLKELSRNSRGSDFAKKMTRNTPGSTTRQVMRSVEDMIGDTPVKGVLRRGYK